MIFLDGRLEPRKALWRGVDYCWGIFPALATLCLMIAAWQWAHERLGAMILPAPQTVFVRMAEILSNAEREVVWETLWRGFLAIMLAVALGLMLGFVAGMHRTLALLCRPMITVLLGMPPIIWVVLAIFWFGMGDVSVIFTVWVVVLPLMFAAAQMSLLTVPSALVEMLDSYRVPMTRQLRYLYTPHVVRHLLPALVVAVGSGLKVTIMAELLGSNSGMGSAIGAARSMLDTTDVMAYVMLMIAVIMLVEYGILEPIRRYFLVEERYAAPK